MAQNLRSTVSTIWRTLASVATGVVLLILVAIFSAVGIVVLQRPATSPEEMQSAYSPIALRILDATGLTNIFHSWWFLGLVFLVSLCIVAASVDRSRNRWRYFSRPYKYPDESFRRVNNPQKSLTLASHESPAGDELSLIAARRALESRGYNPERIARHDHPALFAERHRLSELAVYVVHSGLLLIFFGAIVNGLRGWRGTLNLDEGQSSNVVDLRDGTTRALPFSIHCDAAGQENGKNGTPKSWWSKLTVAEAGRDVVRKKIAADDSLLLGGVRLRPSSFGTNGNLEKLVVAAFPRDGSGLKREIGLALHDVASLDADTTVRFVEFFPDYAVREGQANLNSRGTRNPAAHLVVTAKKSGRDFDVWLPQPIEIANNPQAPWQFQAIELKMGHRAGFEVWYQPGQWGVWCGMALMGFGLIAAFYLVHIRIWVVPVRDPRTGAGLLWIGGCANRNRNGFLVRFNDLVASIEEELNSAFQSGPGTRMVTALKR